MSAAEGEQGIHDIDWEWSRSQEIDVLKERVALGTFLVNSLADQEPSEENQLAIANLTHQMRQLNQVIVEKVVKEREERGEEQPPDQMIQLDALHLKSQRIPLGGGR